MKLLRNLLDKLEPQFKKGGKLQRLYPFFEAGDTFFYTPGETTQTSSHVRDGLDLKRMMILVVIALVPCVFMALHNTGYQANLAISQGHAPLETWRESVLGLLGAGHDAESFIDNMLYGSLFFFPVYIVTLTVGGLWEGLFSVVRGHEINEGFLVTSLLFPLILPPGISLWLVALGISFGIVIGKEIFGGTGKNFMNPALTARAFLYFGCAKAMSGSAVWVAADAISGATPLGALANGPITDGDVANTIGMTWWDAFAGYMPGSMGETSAFACLIGAAVLIGTGIGSWRIMTGVVLGAMATATAFHFGADSNSLGIQQVAPHWHLVLGGFAFGAVFMATDPVSATMTQTGKWFYGILIGVVTVLVRAFNPGYPEGIMLAILFGNVMAPLIDYFVIQANIKRRMARYGS